MNKCALNSQQMREIEFPAINTKDKYLNLMKKAGAEVYSEVIKKFNPCKILIICGSGNNGGDGYVAANLFLENKWNVKILQVAEPKTEVSVR